MSEYSEAVSKKVPDMQPEIEQASKDIAKYQKISVDKMMEYSLKVMNKNIAPTVAALPAAKRFQYADVKEGFTRKISEEYLGITNGLGDVVKGLLDKMLDLKNKEKEAKEAAKSLPPDKPPSYATAAICTSEEMVGKTLAAIRPQVDKANESMMNNMNLFLEDIGSELAGVTGALQDIKNQIPNIEGSVVSALQFENQKVNQFPFQLPPNPSVSDFYTMAEGSGAQPDAMTPSVAAIGDIASNSNQPFPKIPSLPKIPFAEPSKNQVSLDLLQNKVLDAASGAGQKALEEIKKRDDEVLDIF